MSGNLHIPELIVKKRDGGRLTREDIENFVTAVANDKVQQCQIGAMLMAMYQKGLSVPEITDLTRAMMNSGDTLEWPNAWSGLKVDKHSTGGVGDKVSLILAPALAACGLKVPMISGRGLGHTGGTLDKLESIPGFQVSVTSERMVDILETVGCCIVGQTKSLCPADRILYATRDVTGTVDHLGLITASIISKKAAENVDALVLDVKHGKGAIIKDRAESRRLAELMIATSKGLGIKTAALLTNMDAPLGRMIGNALEVEESIRCLQGGGPSDLMGLVSQLGGNLLSLAGKAGSPEEGGQKIMNKIQDGGALRTFCSMLKAQGVKDEVAESLCNPKQDMFNFLPAAEHTEQLQCPRSGYVTEIDAMSCAVVAHKLGAGRSKAGEAIDHSVGLQLLVGVGDRVEKGSPWVKVHRSGDISDSLRTMLETSLSVSDDAPTVNGNRVDAVIS